MGYIILGLTILVFGIAIIAAWFEGLSERPERRKPRKYTIHSGTTGKGYRKMKNQDRLEPQEIWETPKEN